MQMELKYSLISLTGNRKKKQEELHSSIDYYN